MNRFPGPPAYVPTLTDIVHPDIFPSAISNATTNEGVAGEIVAVTNLQALMVQRVLGHVDGMLENRLHEAAEQLIRAQVQNLLPQLIVEIERVVRESVSQAFERELAASPRQRESDKSMPS